MFAFVFSCTEFCFASRQTNCDCIRTKKSIYKICDALLQEWAERSCERHMPSKKKKKNRKNITEN